MCRGEQNASFNPAASKSRWIRRFIIERLAHTPRLNRLSAIAGGVAVGATIWVSFGTLAFTDATASRRIGLVPGGWALALAIAAASAAFLMTATRTKATRALLLSLVLLLPWLPVPVPDAFLAWTGPITTLVWIGVLLCALPSLVRSRALPRLSIVRDARMAPRIASVLAFVILLAVRSRQGLPPTGDEPHYLLIAQSVVTDHDFKVANNYEAQSYSSFYNGPLRPHYSRRGVDGSLYSLHGPGLPVLIAPAFALGGYPAVVIMIAAIAAMGSAFVWKAAHALTGDAASAWFAWAAAALTSPMILEGTLVYPDAIAGTALAAGVLAMINVQSLSLRSALGTGALLGILPWLHTRLAIPAGLLLVFLVFRVMAEAPRDRRTRVALAATIPAAVSVAAWLLFFFLVYGAFSPSAAYETKIPMQPGHIGIGLLALIGDQEFGLIPNAPVHLLWIGGLWTLFRRDRVLAGALVATAVPYVLVTAGFPAWWGASTPARYLAPLVFPLTIAVAPLWHRQDAFGRSMSAALLVISVLIAAAFAFGEHGSLAYGFGEGRSRWLDWAAPLVDLPAAFPSYFRSLSATGASHGTMTHELVAPGAVWTFTLCVVWLCSRWLFRQRAIDAWSAPILVALCLFTTFTLAVTFDGSLARVPHLTPARAQLAFISRAGSAVTPVGLQFRPFRIVHPEDALQQLSVSTSHLDVPPSGAVLFLTEVPPGDYRVRCSFASAPRGDGELQVFVGRASAPIANWSLVAAEHESVIHIPVTASAVTIVAAGTAAAALGRVSLVPIRHITSPWANTTRARDAARYGSYAVYAIDNRVVLDAAGFAILGERQPDVVITAPTSVPEMRLEITNVATPNVVRVTARTWSAAKELAPDERWLVTVPLDVSAAEHVVNFRVEHGARSGAQLLGCRVRFIE